MDLTTLLNDNAIPTSLIVKYLGHHSVENLSKTCKTFKSLFDDRENDNWWKDLVMNTFRRNEKDRDWANSLGGEEEETLLAGNNSCIGWKDVSELVHSKLRRRKALQSLGLSPEYRFRTPSTEQSSGFYIRRPKDINENENLCLLMGNNASENFFQWIHLPYRENDVPTRVIKRSERWNWIKPKPKPKTNVAENRKRKDPVQWSDAELRLLSEAGCYSIGRIRDIAKKAINLIQEETRFAPPLASSGDLGSLDPKLCIAGLGDHPVGLPLDPKFLDRVVQDPRCRQSDCGHPRSGHRFVDRSARMCYEMSLVSDVQVTNPLFQNYLLAPPASKLEDSTMNKLGMWSAIEEQLLPALVGERGDDMLDSSSGIGQRGYRVVVKPNKMLIYGKGGKFEAHRDGKRGPGHFGTLVVVLPVSTSTLENGHAQVGHDDGDTGGALVLRCETARGAGTEKQEDRSWQLQKHMPPKNHEPATWHVFMLGTSHQVQPVKFGYRVALTYQLWLEGEKASLVLTSEPRQNTLVLLGRAIQYWIESNAMEELVEFVLPLRYGYPIDGGEDREDRFEPLKEATLRGEDYWLYRGIMDSLKGTDMELHLEYNGVCLTVAGYPEGVVNKRGMERGPIPLEEQAKVIWLRSDSGHLLVDSNFADAKTKESLFVPCRYLDLPQPIPSSVWPKHGTLWYIEWMDTP